MAERLAHLTISTIPKQIIDEQKYDFHTVNPPTYLGQNIAMTSKEIIAAELSIQTFFHNISLYMSDYAIQLARLNKLRIHERLNILKETENMMHNAKKGNFAKALCILRSYPFIVNCIPTNSNWGLIHYAAFSNDFDVVKAILDSPKCDPSLCTTEVRDGILQGSCTAYDIAQVERVKTLILGQQQRKLEEKGQPSLQTCVSFCYENDIKVESIILVLKCFSNVLYPLTLQSRESLIYSNLMLDIFRFIDTGENWKRARREISLQLQSFDLRDASFLATGQDNGDIMDDISEAKGDFYSRVIQLYNRYDNTNYDSKFHFALNRSLSTDNYIASSFSLEDLALLAYGVLLNSILMYWGELYTTGETTYRGVYLSDKELSLYREGCTFTWFGFNSCCLTRENAHGNVIFVIDNRHTSVYGAKVVSSTKYFTLSNHYLYPSGVQFRVDRVHKESFGSTICVHLEDYSRVQQVFLEQGQEFAAAKQSLITCFKNLEYGISDNLIFNLVKLQKFRIYSSLDISKMTDKALKHAKIGNFNDALAILDEYPYIVNFIPVNRAWGLIHHAAHFNDNEVVKKILKNPKCDSNLRTKRTRDGSIQAGSTAYDIAEDEKLKALILDHQEKKSKELERRSLPKLLSLQDESEIEVESILLMLNCFTNVLYPETLQSRESLIYSNLMLEIFTYIDTGENWKRARRETSLQLQSLDLRDAVFLATGQDNGDITDDISEAKEDFYSRVIQLYAREASIANSAYDSKFYSALNRSLLTHGCNDSFVSGEDLALTAFGALLNSILMYWKCLKPTNKPTYRAMELTEQQSKDYSAGHHFTWLVFSPSSLCKERAKRFGKHIFVINNTCTLQRKYSPKSIMKYSMFDEQEYLYPSGAKFIIDYIQNKNGYMFFYVHLEDY